MHPKKIKEVTGARKRRTRRRRRRPRRWWRCRCLNEILWEKNKKRVEKRKPWLHHQSMNWFLVWEMPSTDPDYCVCRFTFFLGCCSVVDLIHGHKKGCWNVFKRARDPNEKKKRKQQQSSVLLPSCFFFFFIHSFLFLFWAQANRLPKRQGLDRNPIEPPLVWCGALQTRATRTHEKCGIPWPCLYDVLPNNAERSNMVLSLWVYFYLYISIHLCVKWRHCCKQKPNEIMTNVWWVPDSMGPIVDD